MTSSHPQAGLAGDVDEDEVSRVGEAARDATDPFNTVAWGRTFLRRLRALSEVRPDAAAAYVPLASACVTKASTPSRHTSLHRSTRSTRLVT